jgi:hypothetical protein
MHVWMLGNDRAMCNAVRCLTAMQEASCAKGQAWFGDFHQVVYGPNDVPPLTPPVIVNHEAFQPNVTSRIPPLIITTGSPADRLLHHESQAFPHQNALHLAAAMGSLEGVRWLMTDHPLRKIRLDPYREDASLTTAFTLALRYDHVDIVRYLVEQCGHRFHLTSSATNYAVWGSASPFATLAPSQPVSLVEIAIYCLSIKWYDIRLLFYPVSDFGGC